MSTVILWLAVGIGTLCSVLAPQLAAFNNRLVQNMPDGIRQFYQGTFSMGHSFDSSFWIGWNRIGGAVVAGIGTAGLIVRFLR